MADVMSDLLKSEDLSSIEEDDTKACEQILDNFFEIGDAGQADSKSTILETAWEETFNDLFPDLGECTF